MLYNVPLKKVDFCTILSKSSNFGIGFIGNQLKKFKSGFEMRLICFHFVERL